MSFTKQAEPERIEYLKSKVLETLRLNNADPVETYLVGRELEKLTIKFLKLDLLVDLRSV